MRTRSFAHLRAALGFLALFATGCVNPTQQADMIAALNDAASEVNSLKGDFSALQIQVDSLQEVVAKQDSTIARLVASVNLPAPQ